MLLREKQEEINAASESDDWPSTNDISKPPTTMTRVRPKLPVNEIKNTYNNNKMITIITAMTQ